MDPSIARRLEIATDNTVSGGTEYLDLLCRGPKGATPIECFSSRARRLRVSFRTTCVDAKMTLPTPEDPGHAPIWDNYVVAQTVQASLGQIPEHALALGVEVDGRRLHLRFQLSDVTDEDEEDMSDIVSELEALVGNDVAVESSYEVHTALRITPTYGVRWVFLARN